MRITSFIRLLLVVVLAVACARSQSSNDQAQTDNQQGTGSAATPAAGELPSAPQQSQFPPLSGLDEATLEPNVAARSFLVYGGELNEVADTNANNSLHRSPVIGATHVVGTGGLQRLWERYQVALDYIGGGAFYEGTVRNNTQMHELNFDARAVWRTGALTLRDAARYLPDGTFGGGFGGGGGLTGGGGTGIGAGGFGGFGGSTGERFGLFGANSFGAVGAFPRVTNLTILDLQQGLSPRSAVTLAGGYNLTHFTQDTEGLLIDSHGIFAQAGYNRTLNRRNQIALVYGFQHFQFPQAGGLGFTTNVAQFVYGHQISGRMDLLLGAGPQFTRLSSVTGGTTLKLSASARASLRYRFTRSTLSFVYDRFNTAAAGFYAGATTDTARLSFERPIQRRWTVGGQLGYEHQQRLQSANVGVNAGSYQAGFASVRMSRVLSRSLNAHVFYSFNELALDQSFCGPVQQCSRISNRNIVGAGLAWHPHAIRLD